MKRPIFLVLLCAAFIGLLWVAFVIHRERQLGNGFDGVKAGATEAEVLQRIGQPRRVERCGSFTGLLPKEKMVGCAKEYFYASPFSPLLPEYYVVRFDQQNRVIDTASYASP